MLIHSIILEGVLLFLSYIAQLVSVIVYHPTVDTCMQSVIVNAISYTLMSFVFVLVECWHIQVVYLCFLHDDNKIIRTV